MTPANELEDSDDKLLKPEEVIYEAESPDEAALVYTAKGQGSTDRQVGDFQNFVFVSIRSRIVNFSQSSSSPVQVPNFFGPDLVLNLDFLILLVLVGSDADPIRS